MAESPEDGSSDAQGGKSAAELLKMFLETLSAARIDLAQAGPAQPWLDRISSLLGEFASSVASVVPGQPDQMAGFAEQANEMSSLLAETYLTAALSGLRYWRRAAGTWTTHEQQILDVLASALLNRKFSDERQRAAADALRGWLRELGEIGLQEARVFQREMDSIAFRVAESFGEEGNYRRFWKAKP